MTDPDIDLLLKEHQEMVKLLQRAVDAMRATQWQLWLSDGHILIYRCREIEKWLNEH